MTGNMLSNPTLLRHTAQAEGSPRLPSSLRLRLFKDMLLVRRAEEKIRANYPAGDMRCPTHFSIGQEAVSAGVSAHVLPGDYAISAHRSHAHYLNKGGNLRAMFAELYGKADGCASGKGGSMHLIDLGVRFLGCVPIVGSTIPIGVGAAFGAKLQGDEAIAVVFFGDGATESGVFHESLNFAAIHRLRVLFVCENNLYSVNTPLEERQPQGRPIIDLAKSHGIPAVQADGQEVEAVYETAAPMVKSIRENGGPGFLEFATYRWLEHCGPNTDRHLGYHPPGEYEYWTARCPIRLHKELLIRDGLLTEQSYQRCLADMEARVNDAVDFAGNSAYPARDTMFNALFAENA